MSHLLNAAGGHPRPAAADGWIATLDPRTRIIAAVIFAGVTVALSSLVADGLALALALVALGLARLPPGPTLKRVVLVDSFIVVMLLLLPFTVPGPAAVTVFGWPASWAGIKQAVGIALKANAIVLMLLSLLSTVEPTTLGHALARLRCPERLVHLLLFTVRYIAVVDDEYHRLRRAMKARGFEPRANGHTCRSLGYLIGMLLVRALERSERILQAMKCRGFTGRLPLLDDLCFQRRDVVGLGVLVPVLGMMLVVDGVYAGFV